MLMLSSSPENPFVVHTLMHADTGRLIRLYAVRHISPAEDYVLMNEALLQDAALGAAIHVEDVTGTPGTLKPLNGHYQVLADALGWECQKYASELKVENHDAHWSQLPRPTRTLLTRIVFPMFENFADVLSDEELNKDKRKRLLDTFRKQISSASSPPLLFRPVLKMLSGVRETIAVHAALATILATGQDVSLVWGGAHAPSFIRQFREQGCLWSRSELLTEQQEYRQTSPRYDASRL